LLIKKFEDERILGKKSVLYMPSTSANYQSSSSKTIGCSSQRRVYCTWRVPELAANQVVWRQ
jgi:hypothetical protein